MTISLDQLIQGIGTTRTTSPLKDNPAICLYGVSGSGKSLEFNIAIQDAMVVKTNPMVTRPYYSWQREQNRPIFDRAVYDFKAANSSLSTHPLYSAKADQHGLLAVEQATGWRALLPEADIPGGSFYWGWVEHLRNQFVSARQQGVSVLDAEGRPVRGVIFDEWNDIMRLVYAEMLSGNYFPPKKVTGTIFDEMPTMNAFDKWLRDFIFDFRAHGIFLGLVCQEAPMSYDEDQKSKFYGQLKYKIGPVTPFGRLRSILTALVDIMWRITLEAGNVSMTPLALPGVAAANGSALPGVAALPGIAPVNGPLHNASNGALSSSSSTLAAAGASVVGSSTWPLPAKPLKGWSKRRFWTEARPDVEAKTRDVVIPHQIDLGLRAALEQAGFSI
jgi:hypothetical protein